tara:strand:+ start:2555 stop:3097 length:543 start_codon:yes stop_codon:yes gene_type:complete
MEPITRWLQTILDRTAQKAGMLTLFASAAAFGFGGLIGGLTVAPWVALIAFGLIGCTEIVYRQRKTQAIRLSQAKRHDQNSAAFESFLKSRPHWDPKEFEQFTYGGLQWKSIGFEQMPFPLAITGPFCPRCSNHLAERSEVIFPGRLRVSVFCRCGYGCHLRLPLHTLTDEAKQLAGVPK